jgi:signal transduction histidine kinase
MSAADESGRRPLPPDLRRLLHDLRGPLNSITMHAELLKRAVHDDALAEDSVRTVLQQLGRLAEMLPAAFEVASLELGRPGPVDLRTIAAAASHDAGGPVTLDPGPWPSVTGDAALLTLALAHLARNAVDATASVDAARPPSVSASVDGGEVLVTVRDWGRGLPTSSSKMPIRLMHSTKPGHRGLGLVTVERIARLHGGDLRFASSTDGTVVTLALPVRG